jgi:hypothetical protein
MNTHFSLLAATLLAACGLVATGCDQGPKLVPIEGRVTLDGQPLTYGDIRVIPSSGRPAYGSLDEQGRFKLFVDDQEGCPLGNHIVTINASKSITETEIRHYAPAKYESGVTSDLTLEVKGPNKDVHIELKGDGKRYPYDARG